MKNTKTISEPIIEFKDQAELDSCLHWWQEKLFLNDWIITASIIPISDFGMENSSGENYFVFENKESVIHILRAEDNPSESITKFCQEKILIHELLHCKYNFMKAPTSFEGKFYDVIDHQRLEELSKTLLMVKYGLSFDWFKN